MKKLIYLASCLLVCALGNDVKISPEPPTVLPVTKPPTTTSFPPNTTTTTTAEPTTTTTTTTPKPTTTATTTTTTTPKPTTTPTTTTPAPTTAAPVTTTTPKPAKEIGVWALNYTNSSNTCIIMKMALHFDVPYDTNDNKTLNATVRVPKGANATGDCGNGTLAQNITLKWKPDHSLNEDSITFSFSKNDSSKQFMLTSIIAVILPDSSNFPNAKNNATIQAALLKNEFVTPLSMSYRCKKEETLKLALVDAKNVTAKFVVSDMQLQAFHNATGKEFSAAEDCESSETPGIVPIAVGCSLAALIIIVLIAFLVGRRRSQARGYLSM